MPIGTLYGDLAGLVKEDVLDILVQITPEDTPFFQMTGDSQANNIFHQWNRRALTTRQLNANVEGKVFSFGVEAIVATRELNATQIFNKEVRVSGSSQAVDRYAVADQFADQMEARMTELKTDIEHALLRGSIVSGSSTTTARQLKGVIWALSAGSNVSYATNASFDEGGLNELLANNWELGVRSRDVLVNRVLKRRISGFTSSTTKFRDQNDLVLVNVVSVYESDFGVVRIHLSRDIPQNFSVTSGFSSHMVIALDRAFYSKAWLRRPFARRTPEVADSMDGVIIAEGTLEYGHPSGGGWMTAL